jgi:ribonuclease HI
LDPACRRKLMYGRLLTAGYGDAQGTDLAAKLVARGCTVGPDSVRWLLRHCESLPAKTDHLRSHWFRALTNSLFSARRHLPVLQPDPALRAAMPRSPCPLCGEHDDGVEHVLGHCPVTALARARFAGLTGVDISVTATRASSECDAAFLNVATQSKEITLALFVFTRAVWEESRSFFSAVSCLLPLRLAAERVGDVATLRFQDETWRLRREGSLGTKSRRSPAQRQAALERARRVIDLLVRGGIFAYTDGSSLGNPGHSGAGVFFAGGGLGLPCQSWALGNSTNNDAEMFAIGAAAEAIWEARAQGLTAGLRAFVLTDSDTCLSRLSKPPTPGDDALLCRARTAVTSCRAQGPLGLIWVPGHVGVEGNEHADKSAGDGAINSMRHGGAEPRGTTGGGLFLTDHHLAEIRRVCPDLCARVSDTASTAPVDHLGD